MTHDRRVPPQLDHYRDATAICRATLRGDDAGLLALVNACNPAQTFQALVRLHLAGLLSLAHGDVEAVDTVLANYLTQIAEMEEHL